MRSIPMTAAMLSVAVTLAWQSVPSASAQAGPGPLADRFGDRPTSRVLEMMTRRLELTPDQQRKVAAIFEETKQALQAPAAESETVLRQTREKVTEILTPEQKSKAERMKQGLLAGAGGFAKAHGPEIRERVETAADEVRMRAALSSLNLTDEQRGRLKEVEKDLQAKRQALMDEVKTKLEALREEGKDRIQEVLTPEQQESLKQKMSEKPRGFQRPRGGSFMERLGGGTPASGNSEGCREHAIRIGTMRREIPAEKQRSARRTGLCWIFFGSAHSG